jgi:hypothetical protein
VESEAVVVNPPLDQYDAGLVNVSNSYTSHLLTFHATRPVLVSQLTVFACENYGPGDPEGGVAVKGSRAEREGPRRQFGKRGVGSRAACLDGQRRVRRLWVLLAAERHAAA